jgi:uncharacterized DUF497 family protein
VRITFNPVKRDWTLINRGLDFLDVPKVFAGPQFQFEDSRADYGESRIVTVGLLGGRMLILVWTARGDARHIISMRKANEKEQRRYYASLA